MSLNKKKILLSARDVAGAYSTLKFHKLLKDTFIVKVLADEPAYQILRRTIKVSKFKNKSSKNIIKFLKKYKPNAIIGALSAKNYGIDEVLVKNSKKLRATHNFCRKIRPPAKTPLEGLG